MLSGGGGLTSSALDYFRFAQMLQNGGIGATGVRLLSRKTVDLMTQNHLLGGGDLATIAPPGMFSETNYDGWGFGLGVSVLQDPVRAQISGSPGTFAWGGAASTWFMVDPVEDVVEVFLTQLFPSNTYPIRREMQLLVNSAIDD